jgi:hypothetical protein
MRLLHPEAPQIGDDEVADSEVVVAVTRDELAVLASAVGEALQAIDDWEFGTRVGAKPSDARALRDRINDVLRGAFRPD